jgi:hypothetical protein
VILEILMPTHVHRFQQIGDQSVLSRLQWRLWQLLPCTYRTFYGDELGRIHFAVWKMWLGRCYRVNDVIVDTFTTTLDDTLRLLDALYPANRPPDRGGE